MSPCRPGLVFHPEYVSLFVYLSFILTRRTPLQSRVDEFDTLCRPCPIRSIHTHISPASPGAPALPPLPLCPSLSCYLTLYLSHPLPPGIFPLPPSLCLRSYQSVFEVSERIGSSSSAPAAARGLCGPVRPRQETGPAVCQGPWCVCVRARVRARGRGCVGAVCGWLCVCTCGCACACACARARAFTCASAAAAVTAALQREAVLVVLVVLETQCVCDRVTVQELHFLVAEMGTSLQGCHFMPR